ncbi:zinc finger BED domain-containing protein RICESLEEPER 2-like [Arachis ipaensis]|uniref:zinc finger BED domain-containing protein RICESLEEPER 2-like n=1 Tax=Arachis ipaensis TaxID=130454 RepID=UPI000A2B6D29|nr:zinc finger BED domain-containing protein RICESLEEPER 2-like [Arachis ipaensis]
MVEKPSSYKQFTFTFISGNMNSETVSNLVTTGVSSEAAPVEVDEPSSKRLRPATSDVWNFFKKLGPDKDGVEHAECKGCKKVFKAGESSSQLSSNFSQATSSAIGTQLIKIVGDLMSRNQEVEVKSGKNQLDIYLSEATLFYNDAIIDVLQWWKDNHYRFPTLSLMARVLLSIPITTVASKSAFSMGSHVLNKYRSRLLSDNVEAVICTRKSGLLAGRGGLPRLTPLTTCN